MKKYNDLVELINLNESIFFLYLIVQKVKMKKNYIKTSEISWQDEVIHEVFEWNREPKKLRAPDMASRGRGMPKAGPPRPVFSAPTPGGPAAAGRGRGRGTTPASSRPQRAQREPSAAPKKAAKPMAASPFGAPATQPPSTTEDVIAPKEKPAELPTPSPTPAPSIKNTPEPQKPEDSTENRPLQMPPKKEPTPAETAKPPTPAKPAAPKAPKDPNANAGQEGGLYGMMNGLLGFLNLRKQAYTGKPASAIYYDEKKGRYVIAGEEESDDDEPAPPPPGARRGASKPAGEEQKVAEKTAGGNEDVREVSGAGGLAGVAFGGAAINRGRGAQRGRGATRGRGRGGLAGRGGAGRFPEALDPSAVKASDKPESLAQAEASGSQAALNQTALYRTAIEGSQLDISGLPDDTSRVENDGEQNESQSQLLNFTIMDSTQQSVMAPGSNAADPGRSDSQAQPEDYSARAQSQTCDPAREAAWQAAFTKQQGKILAYKRRVQKQQAELLRQREENEQTIETFTQLCQDLKFRGMDEVDDLQGQLRLLQDQVSFLSRDKAELEVQNRKQKFDIEDLQIVNKEYQERIRKQKQIIQENLLQLEMSSCNAEQEPSSLISDDQNQGPGINGGIQANQGLGGASSTPQTWPSSLSRAQSSTNQGEQAQAEILKLLDAQYENEKLEWQLSIHRVDQAHLISEVHKLLKENEEIVGLKQKMKSMDSEMEKQKGLIKTLKDEALAKVQDEQKHDQQEKQQLRVIITKLQQEKERTQELQRERQKDHDMKLQSLQQENQQLEQAIKKLAIEKQSQHNQIERSQVFHQDAESTLADVRLQLQAKEEQMEKARTAEREAQERLNNQKRTEKERMDKNKNEWCDQVKQLEGILSNKEQQYERLRQQKQEVEEQMEQILTTQSQEQQHKEVPNKKSQQALVNQLEQQDQMKHKLNEHIIYLQSEIRKRDELLETSDLDVGSDLSNNSDDEEFEVKLSQTVNQKDLVNGDDHDPDDDIFEKFQQRLQSTPSLKSREEAQRAQAQAENRNETAPSETNTKKVEDQIHQQLNNVDQQKKKKKTMQQLLKDQIEDSRSQLQKEIENRMRKEKDIRLKEETLRQLREGYGDVLKVIKDIVSVNIEHQQSSQAQLKNQVAAEDEDDSKSQNKSINSENLSEQELDEEELVQNAISGVFEIQRYYQAQLSDLTHSLQMEKLKLEDMESLTLDLEILEQEKSITEQEIQQLKSQVTSAHSLLQQKQDQVLEQQNEDELKILHLQAAVDELNLKLVKQAVEHKKQSTQASQGWQERLQQETTRFEREVLSELEQRHEERLKHCRSEMMQYKDVKDKMVEENRAIKSQHAHVYQELSSKDETLATLRGQLQQAEFQLKQASDQSQIAEIEKQELKNAYDNLKQAKEEEVERLRSSLSDRDQEIVAQKRYAEESASQMSQMRKDFDSRSQELVQRRDEHKQQAKDLHVDISRAKEDLEQCKSQNVELLSKVETQAQEIISLKSTNIRREDEMFWPLVQQVSQLKSELTAKEQQRKAVAQELENEKKFLTESGGELQQMRVMYNEKIDQIESEKEAEAKRVTELQAVVAGLEHKRPDHEPTTDQAGGDQLPELQSLVDYQISINDQLNVRLDELEKQNEELRADHQQQIKMTEAAAQRSVLASQFFAHAEQARADELTQLEEELAKQQVLVAALQTALEQANQSASAATSTIEQPGSGDPIATDSHPTQDQQVEIEQLKKQRDFVSRLLEEKTAAHCQGEEQIAAHVSEIQQLKLISTGNADQGELEAQAERSRQELAEVKASLQSEIDHLKEETMQAQYQVELTKAESGFEQDQDLHERQKELAESILVKQAELEQMTVERDREAKRAKELEEREPLFKKAAEDLAKQFKEKLKKLKDENKKYKEDLAEARSDGSAPSVPRAGAAEDLVKVEAERDQLKLEIERLQGEQLSIIDHLEASKEFSVVLDRNSSIGGRDESVLSNIKKLELNLSNLDNKVDSMTQEKEAVIHKILECLKHSGMEGIDGSEEFKSFEHVLEKLQELLQNYDEDRRQLQSLLQDNERVQKENEDYTNMNHDLRYDLQELNIAYEKLAAEQQTNAATLHSPAFTHAPDQEARAQYVLEESREMKAEYIQQINRQEQEVSAPKGQLAAETSFATPAVQADQPVSQRATDNRYADLSINASLSREDANISKSKESKGAKANVSGAPARQPATQGQPRAAFAKPVEKRQAPAQQPAAGVGLFGTIASFFLTESEMEGRQGGRTATTGRPSAQADEASEYEYYEEYDEEEDSDGDSAVDANKGKSTSGSSQSSSRGSSAGPGRPPAQDAYQMMQGGLSNL